MSRQDIRKIIAWFLIRNKSDTSNKNDETKYSQNDLRCLKKICIIFIVILSIGLAFLCTQFLTWQSTEDEYFLVEIKLNEVKVNLTDEDSAMLFEYLSHELGNLQQSGSLYLNNGQVSTTPLKEEAICVPYILHKFSSKDEFDAAVVSFENSTIIAGQSNNGNHNNRLPHRRTSASSLHYGGLMYHTGSAHVHRSSGSHSMSLSSGSRPGSRSGRRG